MTIEETAAKALLETESTVTLKPGYEGGNISTTIGFKHVHYLIEAAVLQHFRRVGLGATELYLTYGVNFDVTSYDSRLHTVLTLDDDVDFEVVPRTDERLAFTVVGSVRRGARTTKAVTSRVEVRLRRDPNVAEPAPLPAALDRFVVDRLATAEPRPLRATPVDNLSLTLGRGVHTDDDPVLQEIIGATNAFGWKWRIPYFYCHFTHHMQMSGFLRQMEEILHLFVNARGIGIAHLLATRGWIPVVSECSLELTDEALMEEDLYTVFTVEDFFKDILYTSRMDCYVVRDRRLVLVATGHITHGYVSKDSPEKDWKLCAFDDVVKRALRNELAGAR
ncbi:hypothetical protein HC031_13170 [Planosporangium thailandense]|uniref:Thioesterase n=1 Tax=Planosporangium thailandense TaxID=765197 RepID=A0ABX0XXA4_9ACTN|nr:hypothetical protein [Planosporangium thailandense]NJC70656.1 hypothetical protein [Planosporangium thailandense]